MVNTFVLHPDLWVNAKLIDNERLGKQRMEAMQILDVLLGNGKKGWHYHPATNMWRGYEPFLKLYINSIIKEWVRRGFDNGYELFVITEDIIEPWWWRAKTIHFTHQANLYLKMPYYYGDLKTKLNINIPTIFDDDETFYYYTQLGYIWPENLTDEQKQGLLNNTIQAHEVAEKLAAHLIEPKYCSAVLSSGARKGEMCHRILQKDKQYCGTHNRNNK